MWHRQIDLNPKPKRRGLHDFFQSDTPTALTKEVRGDEVVEVVEVVEVPSRFIRLRTRPLLLLITYFFLAID